MDEHKEVVKDHYNRHVKNVSTAEVCLQSDAKTDEEMAFSSSSLAPLSALRYGVVVRAQQACAYTT